MNYHVMDGWHGTMQIRGSYILTPLRKMRYRAAILEYCLMRTGWMIKNRKNVPNDFIGQILDKKHLENRSN